MQPQLAYFQRLKPDGKTKVGDAYEVMFNPTDFTLSKGTQLAEVTVPGLDTPLQQFVRGQTEKLTVKLLFDSTDTGMGRRAKSVTAQTDKFYSLVKIDADTHAPPVCEFVWGTKFPGVDLPAEENQEAKENQKAKVNQKRRKFVGVVENIQQEFQLFTPAGVPLRAQLTVTLREYKTLPTQLEQLRLESPDRTRSHVVQRGDTLSGIAGRHYESPADWRPIALANKIEDPRRLRPGVTLRIPPIDRGALR
jgi:hypothetical protein